MIAVIKTGGKQYAVKAGQILKVEKLNGKKGDSISFDKVFAVTDSSNHTIGDPLIKGAFVEAKILDQIRNKKIIVFKKRKRQNYRSTHGHRQYLTVLQIESIISGGKKSIVPKKENKAKKVDIVSKAPKKERLEKIKKKTTPKKKAVKNVAAKKTIKKKTIKTKT